MQCYALPGLKMPSPLSYPSIEHIFSNTTLSIVVYTGAISNVALYVYKKQAKSKSHKINLHLQLPVLSTAYMYCTKCKHGEILGY